MFNYTGFKVSNILEQSFLPKKYSSSSNRAMRENLSSLSQKEAKAKKNVLLCLLGIGLTPPPSVRLDSLPQSTMILHRSPKHIDFDQVLRSFINCQLPAAWLSARITTCLFYTTRQTTTEMSLV